MWVLTGGGVFTIVFFSGIINIPIAEAFVNNKYVQILRPIDLPSGKKTRAKNQKDAEFARTYYKVSAFTKLFSFFWEKLGVQTYTINAKEARFFNSDIFSIYRQVCSVEGPQLRQKLPFRFQFSLNYHLTHTFMLMLSKNDSHFFCKGASKLYERSVGGSTARRRSEASDPCASRLRHQVPYHRGS